MSDHTHIEWTDATWSPVTGCSVVSPGCTNCYAMRLAGSRLQHHPSRAGLTQASKAGPVWTGEVRFNPQWLDQPLRWRRPRRIFVCAHGDLFHEDVPDAWIDQVFAVMALAPQHQFQVLTKRAARMRAYLSDPATEKRIIHEAFRIDCEAGAWMSADLEIAGMHTLPLPNVWLGVSAEDQPRADERIPELLATPAAVRFVSLEPLLGPVDLTTIPSPVYMPEDEGYWHSALHRTDIHYREGFPDVLTGRGVIDAVDGPMMEALDWVILGGESGPGARPMHPDWARQIRDACAAAQVPFFFKQWGAWAPGKYRILEAGGAAGPYVAWPDGTVAHGRSEDHGGAGLRMEPLGKAAAGRTLDGVTHNAMPRPPPSGEGDREAVEGAA